MRAKRLGMRSFDRAPGTPPSHRPTRHSGWVVLCCLLGILAGALALQSAFLSAVVPSLVFLYCVSLVRVGKPLPGVTRQLLVPG
jgi:hypothetical protein